MNFEQIAPYLKDPLVLTGFVLVLFFGFGRAILKAGIIPPLTRVGGYRILARFMLYGFILALLVIVLGFTLKHRELSKAEQERAVRLVLEELAGNLETASELRKNVVQIAKVAQTVSGVMRTPGIPIMAGIFPADNVDSSKVVPASLELSRASLSAVSTAGLLQDPLEMHKFNAAAFAITETIKRTRPAILSLADIDHTRYTMSSIVWEEQLPIVRRIDLVDVSQLQKIYRELTLLRNQYEVCVRYSVEYVDTVADFFSPKNNAINAQRLAGVLAAERIFITTIAELKQSFEAKIHDIDDYLSRFQLAIAS